MAKKPAASRPTRTAAAHAGPAHDVSGHEAPASEGTISTQMDYAAHESMYHRFTGLIKWAIGLSIVAMIFLYIVIQPMVHVAS
jgi:hypothetical protein